MRVHVGQVAAGFRIGNQNNLLAANFARANTTTNYDITTGNQYGQILDKPGPNFGTDNAWANLSL